ncbi:MAG: hypothetical protein ACKOUR_01770, partial [Planctomycetota bacterium]
VVNRYATTERIYFGGDVLACSLTVATAALTARKFIAALTPDQRRLLAERQEEDMRQHDAVRDRASQT